MSDSSDIDNALVALLGADSTLLAICTNGCYIDEAPPGATTFVIVSLIDEQDVQRFNSRSHEDALYLVKAVALSTAGANIKSAAARIDTLLDGKSLTVSGYSPMLMQRESRLRLTEVDDVDASIRWFHRGGNYRVVMSL